MDSSTGSYVMPEHTYLSGDDATASSCTFGTLSDAGDDLEESLVGSLSYASSFAETELPAGGVVWKAPPTQPPQRAMFQAPPGVLFKRPPTVPSLAVPEVLRGPPPNMQAYPFPPMPPMPAAAPAKAVPGVRDPPNAPLANMPVPGARTWAPVSEMSDGERYTMTQLLTAAGTACKYYRASLVTWHADERWVKVRSLLAFKKRFRSFNADPACFEYYAMSDLVCPKS